MEINEIIRRLRNKGHSIGDPVVNSDGKLCVRIDDVSMFQRDAEELALGRAKLDEIIERNRGKNLP
ncbi:MAG TPA: hypothetical protein VM182_15650 [Terriglobia bacterium]|nr:hypothetical protein [Terriglobia bacterium]